MKNNPKQILCAILPVLLLLSVRSSNAATETDWRNYPFGDYGIDANWTNGVPNTNSRAIISIGGTALLSSQFAADAEGVEIGTFSNTSGTLLVKGTGIAGNPGLLRVFTLVVGEGGTQAQAREQRAA